jgi:Tfp pilus assembly protein PilX
VRRPPERGTALIVVVVVVLVLVTLMAAYVGQSVSLARGTSATEGRFEARHAALSGLNRALLELDDSCAASQICSHVAAGSTTACFGNVDGTTAVPTVYQYPANPAGVKQRNLPADLDMFSLDAGRSGSDGWIDFRDQTSVTPGVAIARRMQAGAYTVRSRAEGVLVTDEGTPPFYAVYRLRAYGTARREVTGVEAVVVRQTTRPFQFAAFGDATVVGNGSIMTDSWDSRVTTRYDRAVVKGTKGDLGSNGTVDLSGASAAIAGSITSHANKPVPDADVPPPPSGAYWAGDIRRTETFAQSQVVIDKMTLAGSDRITFAPPSGGIQEVWVTKEVSVTGGAQIVIQQPSPPAVPGTVKFYLTGDGPYKFSGNGIANGDERSAPINLQIMSAKAVSIAISGGAHYTGVVYAPEATLDLSGTAQLMGGVVAGRVTLNSGSFHFDEALPKMVFRTRPIYRITTLVDLPAR